MMMAAIASDRDVVELFHLLFVRTLLQNADTKSRVAIKGGCNLRFYFGSIRYSEDIDFDVETIAEHTLKRNVDKVLAGTQLATQLKVHKLSISGVTAPKQTPTTQRWKVQLNTPRAALHTKIEFSRRDTTEDAVLEPVTERIRERYGLPPLLARHYGVAAAIRQKLRALAGRTETQTRDVFDLSVLISVAAGKLPSCSDMTDVLDEASKRALALQYSDYASHVLAYLEPAEREAYEPNEYWELLQLQVVDAIARMRS